ncbi:metallophosphoesterase [Shimia sp. R9_3]|uniref:metallophosphoesterase n=1 Tax=Alphaproteobacteria TaxID=28211 RepID=UPI0013C8BE1D|nr:metallophosphoesterase family protein [Shimia sp. R9_3]MTI02113.1 serine/threonine protein phosphatase [Roseibium sp. RKSG952]
MAQFLVWSDLHDEFWDGFELPDLASPIDGVLIAGDTNTMGRHLDIPARAARKYGCPVVTIWGNHEPYGSIWSELLADEERQLTDLCAEGLDIRVLHGAVTEIAGVRIIGATLWTDLQLFPGSDTQTQIMLSAHLQDYREIRTAPDTRFTVEDMLERHRTDKVALFEALHRPHSGPTVVMTHHLPVRELLTPWRTHQSNPERLLSNGFASDLWDEVRKLKVHTWICGHSHEQFCWVGKGDHGSMRFVSNQRGYPGERTAFDPSGLMAV